MRPLCENCRVGAPHEHVATWARLIGPFLVIVPAVQVLVCDICGTTIYENDKLERLESLLWSGGQLEAQIPTRPSPPTASDSWPGKRLVHGA